MLHLGRPSRPLPVAVILNTAPRESSQPEAIESIRTRYGPRPGPDNHEVEAAVGRVTRSFDLAVTQRRVEARSTRVPHALQPPTPRGMRGHQRNVPPPSASAPRRPSTPLAWYGASSPPCRTPGSCGSVSSRVPRPRPTKRGRGARACSPALWEREGQGAFPLARRGNAR